MGTIFGVVALSKNSESKNDGACDANKAWLTEDEYKQQLQIFTDKYYDWLAAAMLENSFDQTFLEKQRQELASSDIELDTTELAKAGMRRGLQLVLHPVATMTKLRSVRKRKGKVEPRGADMK